MHPELEEGTDGAFCRFQVSHGQMVCCQTTSEDCAWITLLKLHDLPEGLLLQGLLMCPMHTNICNRSVPWCGEAAW